MKKSLDWGQIIALFFLLIMSIAMTWGAYDMHASHLDGLPVALGWLCAGLFVVVFMWSFLIALDQFRNREKWRKRKFVEDDVIR